MLEMKLSKFLLLIFLIYIVANLFFAGIYYLIGIDHLAGVNTGSSFKNFTEVFFFSAQTFTTVGYGRISPVGFLASAVSTFEAFLGLLSFAIATGLFYGRFSRPQAFLKFSNNALIAPYREGTALMFRVAPYKNNTLSQLEVTLTMAITTEENGKLTDQFFPLDMEISKIMVFVKAFDEVFSNNVVSRTSYVSNEIVWGAKFNMMYHPNEDMSKTILTLDKLNSYSIVEIDKATSSI